MQVIAIVALSIGASVVYGILHDQVTARVCVEYFTIGHPPIFDTDSPTLLAFGWGVIATWWVGLLLGVPLAIAGRTGDRPKRGVRSLVRPIVLLLLVMGASALLAGLAGFLLARGGVFYLVEPLASLVPRERHVPFLADLWAHSASYFVGFVGGVVVIVRVWGSRGRAVVAPFPTMSTVQAIKDAIRKLPPEGLAALRTWFAEFDADAWDRQIEEDITAGRLDALGDEADRAFREGRCTDL